MEDENKKNKDILFRVRDNPWMLSTIFLGILFVAVVIFTGNVDDAVSVESEKVVGEKVLNFLSSRVTGNVVLDSVERREGYYDIIVDFQGDKIQLYAGLNGDYIFSDLVPTEESVIDIPDNNGLGETNGIIIDESEISGAPFKGDANAPVVIVEFSDYQCPFCAKFFVESLPLIDQNYISKGKVKLVFFDFPLNIHPQAQKAAEAARCFAEQGKDYFDYHDKLFENQATLSVDNYKKWAVELGANSVQFNSCLDSGKYATDVQDDLLYGQRLGVSGTPGFFINGMEISGAQPYSVFEQVIEAELAKI